MTRINTNVASLKGLRALNSSNKSLNTSLTRLTTGLKINTGRDNPSGLIASEGLRSQIASIEQSITNSNRANNVIATADAALGEINSLLVQVRGLVQEGLNEGALTQDEIEANQFQIDSALSAINRISSNTSFGGDKLLDGSKSFVTDISTADSAKMADFRINEATFGTAGKIDLKARVQTEAEKAELVYSDYLTADTALEVSGSKGTELVFLGEEASFEDIASAINNVSDATNVGAKVQQTGVKQALAVDVGNVNDNRFIVQEVEDSDLVVKFSLTADDAETTGISVDTSTAGEVTIAVNVQSGTGGATMQDVMDLINDDAQASQYVKASSVYGSATTVFNAADDIAEAQLQSAANQRVSFGDETLTVGFSGDQTINVVYAQGTAGVTVAEDATNDGEITITVTNDFNGGALTLDDLKSQIEGNATANSLLQLSTDGDGSTTLTSLPPALTSGTASTTKIADTLTLNSMSYGSDEFVAVNAQSGTFTTYDAAGSSTVKTRDEGTDVVAFINGQRAQARGLEATIKTSILDASITFSESANVADEEATISINGGGATFQIGQEVSASGQVGVGIEAVNTARLGGTSGKLYELTSNGGKSLLDIDPSNGVSGTDLVNILEEAINEVTSLRGRLGSIQKNVIDTNLNSLGVALENTSESRSAIVDTDFAVETANMTRAQVLQQAGYSALQIANQSPQSVLSLLG